MPKAIWLLVIATTINVTGGSFLWPLNTIYMHNELGQSLAFAGFILMLNQGAAVIGNLIGGMLFDRYSAYKSILYATLIALIAAIILSFNHSIIPYSILLVIIGFGNGMTWPIMFAMAGSLWPDGEEKHLMQCMLHKIWVSPLVQPLAVMLRVFPLIIFLSQMPDLLPYFFPDSLYIQEDGQGPKSADAYNCT